MPTFTLDEAVAPAVKSFSLEEALQPDLSQVKPDAYQAAQLQTGEQDPEFGTDLERQQAAARAVQGAQGLVDRAANVARAVPADVAEALSGNDHPLGQGNIATALTGRPMPIDAELAAAAQEAPVAATVGKISQGLASQAPLLVAGASAPAWAQRAIAAGFSADALRQAPELGRQLGEELGKAPADRDPDKLTSLYAQAIQMGVMAPAGALGAVKGTSLLDAAERARDPVGWSARQMAEQVKGTEFAEPTVPPTATPKTFTFEEAVMPGATPAAAASVQAMRDAERPGYQYPAKAAFFGDTPPAYSEKNLADVLGGVFRTDDGFMGSLTKADDGRLVLDNGKQQRELPVPPEATVADAGLRAVSLAQAKPEGLTVGQYPAEPMPVLSKLQTARNVARFRQMQADAEENIPASTSTGTTAPAQAWPELHPTSASLIDAVTSVAGNPKAGLDQLYGALEAAPTAKRILQGQIGRLEESGATADATEPLYQALGKIEGFENQYLDVVTKPAPLRGPAKTEDILGKPAIGQGGFSLEEAVGPVERTMPVVANPAGDVQTSARPEAPEPESPGVRATAKEFDQLVLDHAHDLGWAYGQTLDDLHLVDPGKNNLGTIGIQGAITRNKAMAVARRNAAKSLGLDPDRIGQLAYRAENIDKIRDLVGKKTRFDAATESTHDEEQKFPVQPEELKVGDTLEVAGEQMKVTKVAANYVEVEDGRKFGKQRGENGKTLYVEGYQPKEGEEGFEPAASAPSGEEDPFATFFNPESVEDQKARLAREEQQRQAKENQAKLEAGAAKPLVGSVGDIGQKDLLGGGDLFAGFGGKRKAAGPTSVTPPAAVAGTPAPKVNPVANFLNTHSTPLRQMVAPHTLGDSAREVANSLRHFMGENATAMARADEALKSWRAEFDRSPVPKNWQHDPAQPLPHNYAVIDALERDPSKLPQRYQDLAATFRKEFDWRIAEIQKYAPNALQHLIDNYFPHVWEDPKKAAGVMAQVSSRLFMGRREFLKQRSLPFFADGLAAGLKPISDNPVDLLMAKMHSMDKFLLALKAQQEWKASGAMRFKYLFERMPDGFRTVDDPAFIVQKPPVVTVSEAFDQYQRARLGDALKLLGVNYERVADLGGNRWAEAEKGMLGKFIRAKVGASEDILWHELGHHIDWRFPELRNALQFRGKGPVAEQLRKIADVRAGAKPVSASQKKYMRETPEKMAEVFRAYVQQPHWLEREAPDVSKVVNGFLDTQPQLRDILQEMRHGRGEIGKESTEIKLGGMQVLGHWIMPDGAAQVVVNHLSPGLSRFAAYRTFKSASNVLNAAQLGLSAFHLGFTSLDASTSRLAAGIEDLSRGHALKAAKTFASVPVSPVTNLMRGGQIIKEALHPGSTDVQTAAIVKALEQAGGRIGQDKFWQTDFVRRFKRALHEGTATGYLKALPLGALSAVELGMKPIMDYIVPRQKLGVFADLAQRELERLGPNASLDDTREAMRKAWDSVDNRMGQVVYDNLFYNRAVKDVALTAFRAYGWQLGKYREGLGALADTAAAVKGVTEGKRPEVSHRMAYALALPLMVGFIGGTLNYLMTGQMPKGMDYFMPKTGDTDPNGNPVRLSLPSYMKDVIAYSKHPLTSLGHSLNPMFDGIASVLRNKDFYDVRIRNPDDPLWKQGSDVARFAAKEMIPFSVSGAMKMHEDGTPLQKQILPFFGIVPAPQRLTMSPAQELAAEITGQNMPGAPRTQEQFDRSKLVKEIIQDFRTHQNDAGRSALAKGFQTGQLSGSSVTTILDRLQYTPLQFQVHHMDVPSAMRVWRVANPQERTQLATMILTKLYNSKTLTDDEVRSYAREILAK